MLHTYTNQRALDTDDHTNKDSKMCFLNFMLETRTVFWRMTSGNCNADREDRRSTITKVIKCNAELLINN